MLLLNVQVVPVDISKNVYTHSLLHSFEQQQWPQMELELMANMVIWHPNTPNTFLQQLFSFMFCILGVFFCFVRVNFLYLWKVENKTDTPAPSLEFTQIGLWKYLIISSKKERVLVSIWSGRFLFPRKEGGGNRISCWVKSLGLLWKGIDWRWDAEEDQIWLPPRLCLSLSSSHNHAGISSSLIQIVFNLCAHWYWRSSPQMFPPTQLYTHTHSHKQTHTQMKTRYSSVSN